MSKKKASKVEDEWTVVKKVTSVKKVKEEVDPKTKMTKAQLQAFIDKMPRIDSLPPLRQSETIFDAFLATVPKDSKPDKLVDKGLAKNGIAQNGNLNKKSNKPKKKVEEKKKVEKPPKSLEEALHRIDASDLKNLMDTTQMRFSESPSLWLKDLECYLNVKLNFSLPDPTYAGKPSDYPLCAVPENILEIIENVFARCNKQVLLVFFERLVTEMLDNMSKGIRTNGNRLLIQALAREHPHFVTKSLTKYANLRNFYQDRYPLCISLFWTVGQVGVVEFADGLKVWLEFMLPFIGVKEYSKFIVEYLESLMDWHQATSFAEYIGVYEFFPIMDTCFLNSTLLPPHLQKHLMKLYPKIKSHSFGAEPRTFFPSFLTRLTPGMPENLKTEAHLLYDIPDFIPRALARLLSCLVHCLVTDAQCFGAWRQMYPKHLLHSSILLEHLLENWETDGLSLSRVPLKETLEKFSATNLVMTGKDPKTRREALTECTVSCTELLSKMHTPSSIPWRLMAFVVLSALSCVFIYDCQLHGSITSSKTVSFLRDIGLIGAGCKAWTATKQYYNLSYQWTEKNVPIYYSLVSGTCAPYLTNLTEGFILLKNLAVAKLLLAYGWVVENIPKVLKWIDDTFPGYMAIAGAYLTQAGGIILDVAQKLWVYVARYLLLVGVWLNENVLTGELAVEKLQQHAYVAVDTLQTYAVGAFQWVVHQWSSN